MALLIFIAVWSISLCVTAEVFEKKRQREVRTQLVWAAKQYIRAIESYYYSPIPGKRKLPKTLDELLEDRRLYPPARHLRSSYSGNAADGDLRLIFSEKNLVGVEMYVDSTKEIEFYPANLRRSENN